MSDVGNDHVSWKCVILSSLNNFWEVVLSTMKWGRELIKLVHQKNPQETEILHSMLTLFARMVSKRCSWKRCPSNHVSARCFFVSHSTGRGYAVTGSRRYKTFRAARGAGGHELWSCKRPWHRDLDGQKHTIEILEWQRDKGAEIVILLDVEHFRLSRRAMEHSFVNSCLELPIRDAFLEDLSSSTSSDMPSIALETLDLGPFGMGTGWHCCWHWSGCRCQSSANRSKLFGLWQFCTHLHLWFRI